MASDLEKELAAVLNRHSAENASNTPDWILAQYVLACLAAFATAVQQRETWYVGRDPRPAVLKEQDELRTALEKSVRLQSLYATLLNQYDEGDRRTFVDAAAWIARLRETGHVE